jgi:hypothetical protein
VQQRATKCHADRPTTHNRYEYDLYIGSLRCDELIKQTSLLPPLQCSSNSKSIAAGHFVSCVEHPKLNTFTSGGTHEFHPV